MTPTTEYALKMLQEARECLEVVFKHDNVTIEHIREVEAVLDDIEAQVSR